MADKVTAKGIIDALSGKNLSDVDDSTMFAVFQSKDVTGYTLKVNGKDVTSDASKNADVKAGVHVIYFKVAEDAAAQDSVKEAWDATKTYKVEITLGDDTYTADITGQTVTLYQDVNASSNKTTTIDVKVDDGKTLKFTSVVPVVSDLEIRLNGHDLSFGDKAAAFFVGDVDNSKSVSLKIVGKEGEQKDQMTVDYSGAAVYVASKGAFEVRNVDFNAGGYAVFPYGNASEVNVVGSDISAQIYCISTNNAYSKNSQLKINVTGSTLTTNDSHGDSTAILINISGAELTINGSTLTGQRQTLVVRAGEATVTGSTIVFENSFNEYDGETIIGTEEDWKDGNRVTEGAVVVGNKSSSAYSGAASLVMSGGSIVAKSGNAIATTIYDSKGQTNVNVIVGKDAPTSIICGEDSAAASIMVSNLKYTATSTDNPDEALLVKTGSVELSGVIDDVKIV